LNSKLTYVIGVIIFEHLHSYGTYVLSVLPLFWL